MKNGKAKGLPPIDDMMNYLGYKVGTMWKRITDYLNANYEFEPVVAGSELDSTIRYRRSGKTLITFYPKEGELTVLIIFGKKEVEEFERSKEDFSREFMKLFDETKQYHDGKWLHIKVPPFDDFDEIKKLLHIKKKPKKSN